MFEDVDHIEFMTVDEYRQALYFFHHPDQYDGDFAAFRDKVINFSSLPDNADRMFVAEYRACIRKEKRNEGMTLPGSFLRFM